MKLKSIYIVDKQCVHSVRYTPRNPNPKMPHHLYIPRKLFDDGPEAREIEITIKVAE